MFSKPLCDLIGKILLSLSDMSTHMKEVVNLKVGYSGGTKKLVSATFRKDIDSLISKLKLTVGDCKLSKLQYKSISNLNSLFQESHFVRCFKPNDIRVPGTFDEIFVMSQLESSGTIAYYQLMHSGYPFKVKISEIWDNLLPVLETCHRDYGKETCCEIFLRSNGFHNEDFKIGKQDIYIRHGKKSWLQKMRQEMKTSAVLLNFKKEFEDFRELF